jgi:hypothetical protein
VTPSNHAYALPAAAPCAARDPRFLAYEAAHASDSESEEERESFALPRGGWPGGGAGVVAGRAATPPALLLQSQAQCMDSATQGPLVAKRQAWALLAQGFSKSSVRPW